MAVPQPLKRTSGIAPNTFWDKTAYVLGVTAGAGKRTAKEHEAFVYHHRRLIEGSDDPGLVALLCFLDSWTAEMFAEPHFFDDMKDQNVVFALEEDRFQNVYLHDRSAARALIEKMATTEGSAEATCLVTGQRAPIAQLHPSIKGVWGAQQGNRIWKKLDERACGFGGDRFEPWDSELEGPMEDFEACFWDLEDPREPNARHNLLEILMIAQCRMLCGG